MKNMFQHTKKNKQIEEYNFLELLTFLNISQRLEMVRTLKQFFLMLTANGQRFDTPLPWLLMWNDATILMAQLVFQEEAKTAVSQKRVFLGTQIPTTSRG